jgi:hypothetical protein
MTVGYLWLIPPRKSEGAWYGPIGVALAIRQGRVPTYATLIGPAGSGISPLIILSEITAPSGTVVTINRATGNIVAADNSVKSKSFVVGLLGPPGAFASFTANIIQGPVTHADWTQITGSQQLLPGQPYFLGISGSLTTIPPSAPSCSVIVGIADSYTTLNVSPTSPLQL